VLSAKTEQNSVVKNTNALILQLQFSVSDTIVARIPLISLEFIPITHSDTRIHASLKNVDLTINFYDQSYVIIIAAQNGSLEFGHRSLALEQEQVTSLAILDEFLLSNGVDLENVLSLL